MATIIQLPGDLPRFRAGLDAVRQRALQTGASPARRRHAMQCLLDEMCAGRSSAAAVALANSSLQMRQARTGGAA